VGLTGEQRHKTPDSVTEQELIRQAKNGSTAAFGEIVKKYEALVAATVVGMLGSCQSADDVGQEVFIKFFKYIKSFRADASLGTYLTRIAINLSINELNRRKRRRLFFVSTDEDRPPPAAKIDDSVDRNETQEIVHQAIQELEPNFRAVVVLRLIEGYSTDETAKILNIPLGTVLSRLSRAQKKLREHLAPYMEEA